MGCSHYQVDYTCCLNNLKLAINLDLSRTCAPTCRALIQIRPCLTGSESTLGLVMSSLEILAARRWVPLGRCCCAVHCHYRPLQSRSDSNRLLVLWAKLDRECAPKNGSNAKCVRDLFRCLTPSRHQCQSDQSQLGRESMRAIEGRNEKLSWHNSHRSSEAVSIIKTAIVPILSSH